MSIVGEAVVRVRAVATGSDAEIKRAGERAGHAFSSGFKTSTKGAFGQFESEASRASRGAVAGSGAFRGLGRSVAFASATFLGTAGLVEVLKSSVGAAADLQKQMERTTSLFSDSAASVKEWSKTTANSLGLARGEALKIANNFGQMLVPLGIAPKLAAANSVELTKLVGNLAAMRNEDPSAVLSKIQAGLRGRGMGLKAYGIDINDARLKEEALRLGLIHQAVDTTKVDLARRHLAEATATLTDTEHKHASNSVAVAKAQDAVTTAHAALNKAIAGTIPALTQEQKSQAAVNLILQQGGRYMGEFGKHSGDLANVQRRLHAEIKNTEEELGKALLPTVTKVATAAADWLGKTRNQEKVQQTFTSTIRTAGDVLGTFWSIFQQGVKIISPVVDALGGFKRVLEVIIAYKFATWAAGMLANLASVAGGWTATGAAATASAAETTTATTVMATDMTRLNLSIGTSTLAMKGIGVAAVEAETAATGAFAGIGAAATGLMARLGPIAAMFFAIGAAGSTGHTIGSAKGVGPKNVQSTVGDLTSYQDPIDGKYHMVQVKKGETPMQAAQRDFNKRHPGGASGTGASAATAAGSSAHTGQLPGGEGYHNLFRGSAKPTQGRIDMGVDFAGAEGAPIYSIGQGVVVDASYYGGWSGKAAGSGRGGYVSVMLTTGPRAGWTFFVAEDIIIPNNIKKGARVGPNTIIARRGVGGSIEAGWAGSPKHAPRPGGTLAHLTTGYKEGQQTAAGKDFFKFLASVNTGGGGTTGSTAQAGATGGATGTLTPTTKVSSSVKATVKGGTALPAGWAEDVLTAIGAPRTSANVGFLQMWQKREGGSTADTAAFNPLCTSLKMPGSISMNNSGVQAYPDWSTGITATAQTIMHHPAILAMLRAGNPGKNFPGVGKEFEAWSGGAYSFPGTGAPSLVSVDSSGLVVDKPKKTPKPPAVLAGLTRLQDQLDAAQRRETRARGRGVAGQSALEQALNDEIALDEKLIAAARKAHTKNAAQRKQVHDYIQQRITDIANTKAQIDRLHAAEAKAAQTAAHKAQVAAHKTAVHEGLVKQVVEGLTGVDESTLATRGYQVIADQYEKLSNAALRAILRARAKLKAQIKASIAQGQAAETEGTDIIGTLLGFNQDQVVTSQDKFGRTITQTIGQIVMQAQMLQQKLKTAMANAAAEPTAANQRAVDAAKKAWDDFASTVSAAVSAAMDAAAAAMDAKKSAFSTAFETLGQQIMSAFDRETQRGLDAMQAAVDEQVAAIQRAAAELTPAEAALASLTSSHDQQQRDQQRQDAQDALKKAQDYLAVVQKRGVGALDTTGQRITKTTISDAQKAVVDAQRSLDDVLYNDQVSALQKKADAERKARDESAASQEEALRKQLSAQEAAYNDQRTAQRDSIAAQLVDWEAGLLDKTKSWDDFIKWLQGLGASGAVSLADIPDPVAAMAAAGSAQGGAFAQAYIDELHKAWQAYQDFLKGQEPVYTPGGNGPGGGNLGSEGQPIGTGGGSGRGGAYYGGTIMGLAGGGEIPGGRTWRDSRTIAVSPGETVIDQRLTNALKEVFLGGGGRGDDISVRVLKALLAEGKKQTELLKDPLVAVTVKADSGTSRAAMDATR